jgi:hypothetical protein
VIVPVQELVEIELGHASRRVDPEAIGMGSGVQKKDADRRILGQGAGHRTAGGAGPDNYVIESLQLFGSSPSTAAFPVAGTPDAPTAGSGRFFLPSLSRILPLAKKNG